MLLPQPYLVYAHRFDPVDPAGAADPYSGLFRLKRATRTSAGDQIRLGAVVEASKIRCAVAVEPYYGKSLVASESDISATTSMEVFSRFSLNRYSDKETFELLRE